jgi:hypothetical protein
MKGFILLVCFLVPVLCFGENPPLKSEITEGLTTATFFDCKTSDVYFGGITSVVSYKKTVSIDTGLITSGQRVAILGGLGINIGRIMKKFPGWDINKILESARLGGYVAKYMEQSLQIDMYGLYIGTYIKF